MELVKTKKIKSVCISNKMIKDFIKQYVGEYRQFLEDSYPNQKNSFLIYKSYPFHIIAYVDSSKTLIEYQPNTDKFVVRIKTVDKLPEIDRKKKYIGAFRNDYLLRVHKEAKRIAREDILSIVAEIEAHERSRKELADYYERQYAEYIDEHITSTLKGYISYVETAYDVKKETTSKQKDRIYGIVTIIDNARACLMEALLNASCLTLYTVFEEILQDVESSLFLTLHGRYRPANAILRRLLETMMTALFFDAELQKCKHGSKTYDHIRGNRDVWVDRSRSLRFTGEYGILGILIDPDTDYIATEVLKATTKRFPRSFRAYVEKLYGDLSKFVHYGGLRSMDELSLEFAEFDEKQFENWFARFNQVYEICNLLAAIKFPKILEAYEKLERKLEPFERVSLLVPKQVEVLRSLTK